MTSVDPSMRLKVKPDTWYVPDDRGGVFFRNNNGSFRMQGKTIYQWVERLLPEFTGESTLEELTDGLPDQYRTRVFEIAELLVRNGFIRDTSHDTMHTLPDDIVVKYQQQIGFLDNLGPSGAYRFQGYRETKVLVVGSGHMLVSAVSALYESGCAEASVLLTDDACSHHERLQELLEHTHRRDSGVKLTQVVQAENHETDWESLLQSVDWVLYVSGDGNIDELRALEARCKTQRKFFLPAVCIHDVGLAGPVTAPEGNVCFESAWRRLHESSLSIGHTETRMYSSTAGAVLANIIVFEMFKRVANATGGAPENQEYVLNLETLEGDWHPFLPHPLVTNATTVDRVDVQAIESTTADSSLSLLPYFSTLTSTVTGIFHTWEEGELTQLPLAQCQVVPVHPISDGPAMLLPKIICSAITHEEARREAGLCGLEAYAREFVRHWRHSTEPLLPQEVQLGSPDCVLGVGIGQTSAEGILRGLCDCLRGEFLTQWERDKWFYPVELTAVDDEPCQYYLEALSTLAQSPPRIALTHPVHGFSVAFVKGLKYWHGSAHLNPTLALRHALVYSLQSWQNPNDVWNGRGLILKDVEASTDERGVLSCSLMGEIEHNALLNRAVKILKEHGKRLQVFRFSVDSFLEEEIAGVFGVALREEDSQ